MRKPKTRQRTPSPTPEQVKAARARAGLSSDKAAQVIEVSGRQWQKYEAGDARMNPVLFRYFCIVYNMVEVKP